jgi:hypothetical protein
MDQDKLRLDSIFLAAVEKATPEERCAFLDRACGSDHELRERIDRLLAGRLKVSDFLKPPPLPETTTEPAPGVRPGITIGPYKLLEQIGEGGFGVVFMAEQTQPVRRKVALKVIKPGMDTARSSPASRRSGRHWRSWIIQTLPTSSMAAKPSLAGRISSWSWSRASPSPTSATRVS